MAATRRSTLIDYLESVLTAVDWVPDPLYCLDVCESGGELYVLEIGSYNCAGEYACDLDRYIEAANQAATETHAEAYGLD